MTKPVKIRRKSGFRNPFLYLDTPLRKVNAVVVVASLIFAVLFPFVVAAPTVGVGFIALLYALRNFTFNIAGGYAGLLSLAHIAAFGIGAFSVGVMTWRHGWNVWLALLVGIIIAAVVGYLISLLLSRFGVNSFFYILGTLAVSLAFAGVAAAWSFLGDVNGISNKGTEEGFLHLQWFLDATGFYYTVLGFLIVIVIGTAALMKFTKFGRSLPFIREDPGMAASMGIRVIRNQALAMGLSMGLTAISGSLLAQYIQFVSYDSVLSVEIGLAMLVGTIIGGAGTLAGPIVAGIGLEILAEFLRSFNVSSSNVSSYTQIVYGVFLIVLLRFGAHGIMPIWNSVIRAIFGSHSKTSKTIASSDKPASGSEQLDSARQHDVYQK